MELLLPPRLQKGDTIAFVTPGIRLNDMYPRRIARAGSWLVSQGYNVKIIYSNLEGQSFHESVLHRCAELQEAFRDPSVNAIVCTAGGDECNELLTHLDYDVIKQNPKIFCGFSGVTLLHYAILAKTGLTTFYGPTALTEFSEYPQPFDFTANHFWHVLQSSTPVGPIPRSPDWVEVLPDFEKDTEPSTMAPSPPWIWLRPGKAAGRLIGGCLRSVVRLPGTSFWPDLKGRILLLETGTGDSDMDAPFPIEESQACIADLYNVGVFGQISGLVIGRPYAHSAAQRSELARVIVDQCHGTDFPILMNVDFGHSAPNLTLPYNAMAQLDSTKDEFVLLDPVVR